MKKDYAFLIKNTFICWTRFKIAKFLKSTTKLIMKNSVSCFKNQAVFVTRWACRKPLRRLLVFTRFLRTPFHNKCTFWKPPSVLQVTVKVKKDSHVHEHTYSVCKGLWLLMVTPRIFEAKVFLLTFTIICFLRKIHLNHSSKCHSKKKNHHCYL